MVKLTSSGPGLSGPSSSIGIMRFFDADTKGPKLTPEFVIGLAVAFIALVLAVQYLKIV